jgi:hypothetical protein
MDGQVTAFFAGAIVARGSREAVRGVVEEGYLDRLSDVRVFEDGSGRVVDLDIWDAQRRRRGRPSRAGLAAGRRGSRRRRGAGAGAPSWE